MSAKTFQTNLVGKFAIMAPGKDHLWPNPDGTVFGPVEIVGARLDREGEIKLLVKDVRTDRVSEVYPFACLIKSTYVEIL